MQPYNGDHHISYFQCRCQPRPAPPCYVHTYEPPQYQTQQPSNQPFQSPFSIDSLLGGDTSQDMVAFSSLPAKKDGFSSTAAKLKRLEERRRSGTSQEKSTAGSSTQLQGLHSSKSLLRVHLISLISEWLFRAYTDKNTLAHSYI